MGLHKKMKTFMSGSIAMLSRICALDGRFFPPGNISSLSIGGFGTRCPRAVMKVMRKRKILPLWETSSWSSAHSLSLFQLNYPGLTMIVNREKQNYSCNRSWRTLL
jgi:hypothetical protein